MYVPLQNALLLSFQMNHMRAERATTHAVSLLLIKAISSSFVPLHDNAFDL